MTNPRPPQPPDPDQPRPGLSKTLEENATRFRETTPEERTHPRLRPVVPPPGKKDDDHGDQAR